VNILLGVTGSISCYKSYDLLRLFIKDGHNVKVITTSGAEKFIKPDLFRYLGAENIYHSGDDFNLHQLEKKTHVIHIELAKWAEHFVMAPLSANTLSKLSCGLADDLLSSTFLAFSQSKPISLFPAMNTSMLTNPLIVENQQRLKRLENINLYPTQSGELACGDIGAGKLLSIDEIFHLVESTSLKKTNKNVLITTGATISPLDSVRYLTNPSSGKSGLHLAKAALQKGHNVVMIAGLYATSDLDCLVNNSNFTLIRVGTADEMKEIVHEHFSSSDIYISSAAISDIQFDSTDSKIKKNDLTSSLPIRKSVDILKSVIEIKKDHQKVVGFAAEIDLTDQVIHEKLIRKPVDILVATEVNSGQLGGKDTLGFQKDSAHYRIIKDNKLSKKTELTKSQMAATLFNDLLL